MAEDTVPLPVPAGQNINVATVSVTTLNGASVSSRRLQRIIMSLLAGGAATDLAGGSGVVTAGTVRAVLADDVGLPAGENHVGQAGFAAAEVSAELTRPANTTAYPAGAVVSESAVTTAPKELANLARKNGAPVVIIGAKLTTNKPAMTARFEVHLWNAAPATLAADGALWVDKYADVGKGHRSFVLPAMAGAADTVNTDTSEAEDQDLAVPFAPAAGSRSAFFLLRPLDGFTPSSGQKFTLALTALQS